MPDRRTFIQQSAAVLGGLALHQNVEAAFPGIRLSSSNILDDGDDADFWRQIRAAYACSPTLINLTTAA